MPTPSQIDRRVFLKLGLTLGATSAAALGSGAALVSAQEKPKKGGVLTIGRNHDADTLYPGRSTGLSAIATNLLLYDGLVLHDFQMKIRPALAEKWDVSADGLTWTFSLRKNVKFHCGAPLTAQDVKEHFDRWIDPKESVPTRAKMASLQETRVVDDHTVVFKLKNPTLVFLNNVSQTEWGYASIPHAKHVGQYGQDYGVVPASVCGTGPYRLKEWIKDDRMEHRSAVGWTGSSSARCPRTPRGRPSWRPAASISTSTSRPSTSGASKAAE
jgi:peptide/nickel transport system substrate-binding protein